MHASPLFLSTTALSFALTAALACACDSASTPTHDRPMDGRALDDAATRDPSARNAVMSVSPAQAPYAPKIAAGDFVAEPSHALFPLLPGMRWVYESHSEDGLQRIEIDVLMETKEVWGVTARVVHDLAYLDGEVIEDTLDWFAQDRDGNVWYLGEDSTSYEAGQVKCTCGSWEAGKNGALPGIQMLAQPQLGTQYRQEYLAGEAEDVAEVLAIDAGVSVPQGSYEHCLETFDTTALEPDVAEHKFYCPGVGLVLETEAKERVELVEFKAP